MKLFWNRIKKSRETGDTNYNNISLVELENHFKNKFSYNSENENSFIANAREQVEMKLSECQNVYNDFVFTVTNLRRFIKNLKNGCAPGGDSITSEHVKLASNTDVVLHLCNLFTVCFKFGVVPDSFNNGILVPLLKKSTLDPSVAKNYRPVVLSTVFSKIMEMYILTQCADYKYNDYQFGFISSRGTQTAIALANDVLEYCNYNESAVFVCNLDAEGAYDGIPHPILFMKSMNIIPDMSWKLLYRWYNQINVKIKWNKLGNSIKICKGTRQGGITSTFLFNIFYRELIDILSNHDGGIKICNQRFNIFCYADDILLVSTTKSGLQNLIDTAVKYVDDHRLRFNPSKTVCLVKGDNPFVFTPKFYIKNCELRINDSIVFL